MDIVIHKNLLGTNHHVTLNSDRFCLQDNYAQDSWIIGDSKAARSIDDVAELYREQLPLVYSPAHLAAFKSLNLGDDDIVPWHFVLGKEDFNARVERLFSLGKTLLNKILSSKYDEMFLQHKYFFSLIAPISVDTKKLDLYIRATNDNPSRLSTLKSFMPEDTGFAKKINYSLTSTVTGRLTVVSGPRILTQPAETRDIISSRYHDGTVYSVDFVSLEPRVIRHISGGCDAPADIYQHVQDLTGNSGITRAEIKKLIISCIYGASRQKLSSMSNVKDLPRVINLINDFFGMQKINERLERCYQENGHIINYFGRPIIDEKCDRHTWLSHYAQSSSVDLALDSFLGMTKDLSALCADIVPVGVIHDAILYDVPGHADKDFCDYTNNALQTRLGPFPVSRTVISRRNNV